MVSDASLDFRILFAGLKFVDSAYAKTKKRQLMHSDEILTVLVMLVFSFTFLGSKICFARHFKIN